MYQSVKVNCVKVQSVSVNGQCVSVKSLSASSFQTKTKIFNMGTVFAATFDNQSCFLDVPISVPGHFACLYEMCTVTVRMLTFKQVVCHLSNVFAYILSVATKCVYLSIIWEKKVQVWEF